MGRPVGLLRFNLGDLPDQSLGNPLGLADLCIGFECVWLPKKLYGYQLFQ